MPFPPLKAVINRENVSYNYKKSGYVSDKPAVNGIAKEKPENKDAKAPRLFPLTNLR